MNTCYVCSLNYARCMNESKSFYLVIECQGSLWNPFHHLPVQAGIILHTVCWTIFTLVMTFMLILGWNKLFFKPFQYLSGFWSKIQAVWSNCIDFCRSQSAKSLQGQSYVMQKTSLFLFKWKRIFKFVFIPWKALLFKLFHSIQIYWKFEY